MTLLSVLWTVCNIGRLLMRFFLLIRISNHGIPALRRPSLVPLWPCAVSSSGAGYLWWRGEGGLAKSLFPANCDDMGG